MPISFPDTKYFMVMWRIPENFGGMTSMCLKRAKNMRTYAGVHAPILSFDTKPDYEASKASLVERGYLTDEMEIINIFEYYRHSPMVGRRPQRDFRAAAASWDAPVPEYKNQETTEIVDGQGRLFALITRNKERILHRKYYRQDGSIYFVDTVQLDKESRVLGRNIWLIDRDGNIAEHFKNAGQFYRQWLNELTDGQPTTFIFDDKAAATILRHFDKPHVLMITPVHSRHASEPIRGNLSSKRFHILTESSRWDGLVFLTERQKADYVVRYGKANNVFAVSNPSERKKELPVALARRPHRGVMVANLRDVKNISLALDIVKSASTIVPDILLDIYGTGPLEKELQQEITRKDLSRNVVLRGFQPNAAEEYLTASFSLFTSKFEGQSLSLMESMGHGCPPVAFDFRYGPSDLFTDGVSGFLVPDGDVQAAAARVVELCNNPESVAAIGRNAWSKMENFGNEAVLEQWSGVIEQAWKQKPDKLQIKNFALTVTGIANGGFAKSHLSGRLVWETVSGNAPHEIMNVRLQLVAEESGPAVEVPVKIKKRQLNQLEFSTRISDRFLAEARPEKNKQQAVDVFVIATARNVAVRRRLARHDGDIWRDTTSL